MAFVLQTKGGGPRNRIVLFITGIASAWTAPGRVGEEARISKGYDQRVWRSKKDSAVIW